MCFLCNCLCLLLLLPLLSTCKWGWNHTLNFLLLFNIYSSLFFSYLLKKSCLGILLNMTFLFFSVHPVPLDLTLLQIWILSHNLTSFSMVFILSTFWGFLFSILPLGDTHTLSLPSSSCEFSLWGAFVAASLFSWLPFEPTPLGVHGNWSEPWSDWGWEECILW